METSCVQFVENLITTSDVFLVIRRELFEYWEPDQPPVTVLFAALGKELVRQFDAIDKTAREAVFRYIEDGMNSKDDSLVTAVATGMIEAIVSESVRSAKWPQIEMCLGDLSKRHARKWHGGNF
jgi:hypothetical protein